MSEIRENETTEIFRGKSLPPEFLSGRTLDYAVNMIKDNPLDDTSQNIISRFQEDYPQLKSIFPRTSEELQNLSEKEKKERNRRFQENYKRSGKENVGSASETTGQSIIMADASGNGFYDQVEADMGNFFDRVTKIGTSGLNLSSEINDIVSKVSASSNQFIGQIGNGLSDSMVGFMKSGMAAQATQIFALYPTNPALAVKIITSIQKSLIPPAKSLFNGMDCLTSKVGNALVSTIKDMITGMMKNVINAASCAVQQFVGGLVGKITGLIDGLIGPLLNPISSILKSSFNVKQAIFGGLNTMKKVGSLFSCGEQSPTNATSKYVIDAGPKASKSEIEKNRKVNQSIAAANSATSALDGITDGLSNFEKNYGQWSIFGSKINEAGNHGIGNCYTGNVFACGAPKVEIFGGAGGRGATGEVILGKFVDNLDKDDIYGDIKRTGSILGVNITSPGEGYTEAPLISFSDNCNQGYGAYGKAVIDTNQNSPTYGQLIDIIITSPGTNYPTDGYSIVDEENVDGVTILDSNNSEVYVDKVIVDNGGSNFNPEEDDLENDDMSLIINNDINSPNFGTITGVDIIEQIGYDDLPTLNIKSKTGVNAVLRPVLKVRKRIVLEQVLQKVQCVGNFPRTNQVTSTKTPRKAITMPLVGYVDGQPYFGPFHQMSNGQKMTGSTHSDSSKIITSAPLVGYVDGQPYFGPFHQMSNGQKMTGSTHSDSSKIITPTPQRVSQTTTRTRTTTQTRTSSSSAPASSPSSTSPSSPPPTSPSSPSPSSPPSSPPPSSPPSSPPPSSPPPTPPSSPPSGGGGYGGGY